MTAAQQHLPWPESSPAGDDESLRDILNTLDTITTCPRGVIPGWAVMVSLFPKADELVLLGPAAAGESPVLHALKTDLVTLSWTPESDLATAIRQGGVHLLTREAGQGEPLVDIPRTVTHHGRKHLVWPTEVVVVPLPGGHTLLRLAYAPAAESGDSARILAQVLSGHLAPEPPPGAIEVPVAGELALAMLGATNRTQLAARACVALEDHAPGLDAVLYELDSTGTTARALSAELPGDWKSLEGRSWDAVRGGRPLIGLSQDTPWLNDNPALPLCPEGEFLDFYPFVAAEGPAFVLVTGRDGRCTPASEALLASWLSVLRLTWPGVAELDRLTAQTLDRDKEMQTAAVIQRSLLPEEWFGGEWALALYQESDRDLAGDFVLVDARDEVIHLAIGDVAGRGIPASLTMMAGYSLLLAQLHRGGNLETILSRWSAELNRLTERNQDRGGDLSYTTAVVVEIARESGVVRYAKAGHPYPLCYHAAEGAVSQWDVNGYPAGLFAEQEFEIGSSTLDPGDALLLYTDGVSEADIGEGQFGMPRLHTLMERFGGFPASIIRDQLLIALEQHLHGGNVGDDTTFVVLTRAQADWQSRENVPLAHLRDTYLHGLPAPPPEDQVKLADLQTGLEGLQGGLAAWVPQAPDTWSCRWMAGPALWHGILAIPELATLLPDAGRASRCMALLDAEQHPLRGFMHRMDFVWVDAAANELHFVRRW